MAELIFLVNCGGCPDWKRDSKMSGTVDGFCKRLKEARHCRRELCEPVWSREVKKLARLSKLKDSQLKAIMKDGYVLNPRLACEAAGAKWPEVKQTGSSRVKK